MEVEHVERVEAGKRAGVRVAEKWEAIEAEAMVVETLEETRGGKVVVSLAVAMSMRSVAYYHNLWLANCRSCRRVHETAGTPGIPLKMKSAVSNSMYLEWILRL